MVTHNQNSEKLLKLLVYIYSYMGSGEMEVLF